MSIWNGGICHFGLRSRLAMRSARLPAAMAPRVVRVGGRIDPRVKPDETFER
jgi:hypothetical protein